MRELQYLVKWIIGYFLICYRNESAQMFWALNGFCKFGFSGSNVLINEQILCCNISMKNRCASLMASILRFMGLTPYCCHSLSLKHLFCLSLFFYAALSTPPLFVGGWQLTQIKISQIRGIELLLKWLHNAWVMRARGTSWFFYFHIRSRDVNAPYSINQE